MNLRYIIRDGKKVLQWSRISDVYDMRETCWRDVPTDQKTPEPTKPREFWVTQTSDKHYSAREKEHNFIPCIEDRYRGLRPIHVTELPKGSRVVSRDDIKVAYLRFNECNSYRHRKVFDLFLKELGFDND